MALTALVAWVGVKPKDKIIHKHILTEQKHYGEADLYSMYLDSLGGLGRCEDHRQDHHECILTEQKHCNAAD